MSTDATLTYGAIADSALATLRSRFSPAEARWMVRIIFMQLKSYTPTDMIIKSSDEASEFFKTQVNNVISRLLDNEPIQYIFGTARFYGMDFHVDHSTLIPRPETEQLVDMIVDRYANAGSDLHVLDIATGSGCIAIALARNLRFPLVDAIDISPKAIEVARGNASTLHAGVNFSVADILTLPPPSSPIFDIIVSNPPYIAESEKKQMEPNVLLHEPPSALFVPDDDPLLFYRAISQYALKALHPYGTLWLEINPLFADSLKKLLESDGWVDIKILPDERRKLRFATAVIPS